MNTIYSKNFWKSLLWRQNDYHRYGVFRHTIMVAYHILRAKEYRMFTAALLHDFGKPYTANADEKDIARGNGELSFTNHEEMSYQIIKNWFFLSEYTKLIVRHHYLIRGIKKSLEKGQLSKNKRLKKRWSGLSDDMKKDLAIFIKADDLAKK